MKDDLKTLHEHYKEHRALLEMTEYERCIRLLTSAYTTSDPNYAMEEFKRAVDILDHLGEEYRMDKAMIYFRMAQEFDSSRPEESLQYINAAIELSDTRNGDVSPEDVEETMDYQIFDYDSDVKSGEQDDISDDYTECTKAEMLGLRGLILKNLQRYKEAYDSILAAVIRYEDIEDIRMAHGDMLATVDEADRWRWELMEVSELITNTEEQ